MVTFNHGFAALVCGRAAMPLLARRSPISERAMAWAFFLGGVMPDADYVSKLLGRAAYFSGEWYGHRGASHSLLGTLLMAALGALVFLRPLTGLRLRGSAPAYLWLAGCAWAGGLLHIVGDMFTPARSLPVLWPFAEKFGSLSHIGWFSPYLFWLFVTTLLIAGGLGALAKWRPETARWHGIATWLLFTAAAGRWVQFMLVSRYDSYSQWVEYQRTLLPEPMINGVTRGVSYLWFWLTG